MDEEKLNGIITRLNENKFALEREDGHEIESISMGDNFDKDGHRVKGVSIRYSGNVVSNTDALPTAIEKLLRIRIEWLRISPKGLFVYFS